MRQGPEPLGPTARRIAPRAFPTRRPRELVTQPRYSDQVPSAEALRATTLLLILGGIGAIAFGVIEAIDIASCTESGPARAIVECPQADFANVYGPILIGVGAIIMGSVISPIARVARMASSERAREGLESLERYRVQAEDLGADGVRSRAASVAAEQAKSVWEQANRKGRPGAGADAKNQPEGWESDPENLDPLSGR